MKTSLLARGMIAVLFVACIEFALVQFLIVCFYQLLLICLCQLLRYFYDVIELSDPICES